MAFQFKIQLKNITDPPVWRRIIVPEHFTFMRLHKIIQAALGWENYHLFRFSPRGYTSYPVIQIPHEDDDLFPERGEVLHAVKTKLFTNLRRALLLS